jgi:hypothetical protein
MKKLLLIFLTLFTSAGFAQITMTTPTPKYGCPNTTQSVTIGATNNAAFGIPGSVVITVNVIVMDNTNTITLGNTTQTMSGLAAGATKYITIPNVAFQGPMVCNISGTASFTYFGAQSYPFTGTYTVQYPPDLTASESPAGTIAISTSLDIYSVRYYFNGDYGTVNNETTSSTYTPGAYGSYTAKGYDPITSCLSANPSNAVALTLFKDKTSTVASGITPTNEGNLKWADIDNDNDLDFIITGTTSSGTLAQLWRNGSNGASGAFTDQTSTLIPGLPGYGLNSTANWGDYDKDGDLDLLIEGFANGGSSCQIWRNGTTGATGAFTDQTSTIAPSIIGAYNGVADWLDYDNDGDLDIFVNGYSSNSGTEFYQFLQNGTTGTSGTFSDQTSTIAPGLINLSISATAWGDYYNDGDLDLLINGMNSGGSAFTQIWKNGTSGTTGIFTNVTSSIASGLPGCRSGSVNWMDYDNDGDLDLYVSGYPAISQIWRNGTTGTSGTFSNQTSVIAPGFSAATAGIGTRNFWGDYDNDGDLDLLISSWGPTVATTQIWRNGTTGASGTFTDQTNAAYGVTQIYQGSGSWADYDLDHDLDFIINGINLGGTRSIQVWENGTNTANTAPSTPGSLSVSAGTSSGSVILKWTAASDNNTPKAALSYNVRVGTASGLNDIVSAYNLPAGFNRFAAMGNAQLDTMFALTGLTVGNTYYWSVQAIDNNYEGSAFSTENSFTVKTPQQITFGALSNATIGDVDFSPGATSTNAGIAITYTSSNTAVVTIVSGNIHVVGAGTATITAHQAGDATHYAAADVSQSITIVKMSQTITFNALNGVNVGDADFAPGATSTNNTIAITYTSSNPAVATIVSGNIHIVGTGTAIITAQQAGDASYDPAADVTQPLTVNAVSAINTALAADIKVYPNPSSDLIYVELESSNATEAELTLTNMMGIETMKIKLYQQGNTMKAELPIGHLSKGLYLLHIETNIGAVSQKIEKK